MKSVWIRTFGIFGLIFVFFGAVAAIFFRDTFLAPAAYVEIALGLIAIGVYGFFFFKEAAESLWKRRDLLYGVLGGLLGLFILIGLNVVAQSQLGERKFDLTVNRLHSLSEASIQVAKDAKNEIQVLSFVSDPRSRTLIKNLIDRYRYHNPAIEFSIVDPDRDPTALERYEAQLEQVVFFNRSSEKAVKLDRNQISEQEFTTALRRALVGESKQIYFLQGNAEPDLDDDQSQSGLFIARLLLEREGYQVRALDLSLTGQVPEDADLVIGWGAKNPTPESSSRILEAFVEDGGKLVLGIDPVIAPSRDRIMAHGYGGLLRRYGLETESAIILQIVNFQGQSLRSGTVIGMDYSEHPIVESMNGNMTQFSIAQPVRALKDFAKSSDWQREVLVSSGPQSGTETNIADLLRQSAAMGGNTALNGPHPIAQISERSLELGGGALVVFGDADFALNNLIQSQFNRDLFLNTVGYLVGRPESISIRPKAWKTSTLDLSVDQKKGIYFASLFIIPQLIILFGLAIWSFRRQHL